MADVVISYKSEERAKTATLAHLLRLHDLSVWWDDSLQGERADPEIRDQMAIATAIIVLLSRRAVLSDWVLGEIVRAGDKLVPVRIDDLPYDDLPTQLLPRDILDMPDWQGQPNHPEFLKVVARCIHLKTGQKPVVVSTPAGRPARETPHKERASPPSIITRIGNISGGVTVVGTGNKVTSYTGDASETPDDG